MAPRLCDCMDLNKASLEAIERNILGSLYLQFFFETPSHARMLAVREEKQGDWVLECGQPGPQRQGNHPLAIDLQ